MTALLDDYLQSQGNCGGWNNFNLPVPQTGGQCVSLQFCRKFILNYRFTFINIMLH